MLRPSIELRSATKIRLLQSLYIYLVRHLERIKRASIEYCVTVTQTRVNGSPYTTTVTLTVNLAIKIYINTSVPVATAHEATDNQTR